MKKLVSLVIILLIIDGTSYAQTAGDAGTRPTAAKPVLKAKPSNLFISLKAGKLLFNKVELSKTWKIEPVTRIMRSSGRVRDGANTTHSYDDDGIVAFERTEDKKPSGELIEFQVYFSAGDKNSVTPEGLYGGKMEIEGLDINFYLSLDDLRDLLKDYKEDNSYMDNNYRFSKNGIYMYVQYDEDDEYIEKISFGKDKRGQ